MNRNKKWVVSPFFARAMFNDVFSLEARSLPFLSEANPKNFRIAIIDATLVYAPPSPLSSIYYSFQRFRLAFEDLFLARKRL